MSDPNSTSEDWERNDAARAAEMRSRATLRYRLELEHADGEHSEPETVNRFCPSCAQEYFGPDAEPDEPGDVGALFGGYRWNAAVRARELAEGRPEPAHPTPANFCSCESAWCDHHGGNARTRTGDDFPTCDSCQGSPTGRYSMDFLGDVCAACALVPENGTIAFDHETGAYLSTARRLDTR